jgi:DNA adenine methylase
MVINVSSVVHRSIFRYPGGKTWFVPLAKKYLLSLGHKPNFFLEPFSGGGIVGLSVAFDDLADMVVFSEIDPDVSSVWKTILSDDYGNLCDRILSFNMSAETAKEILSKDGNLSNTDKAFRTIVKNRVMRGGILAPGASMVKNGENGKGVASRWYPKTFVKRISDIYSIRHKITFFEADAFSIIDQNRFCGSKVFFIDPPYSVSKKNDPGRRLYSYFEVDHKKLFSIISQNGDDFLMTYNDTEDVSKLSEEFGFSLARIPMRTCHHKQKNELLIGNNLSFLG